MLFPNPSSAQLSTSGRYWPYDINSLHANYGTADDLKSLSTALHSRDMYLMVDVVVNNVMSTSITPDLSTFYFKEEVRGTGFLTRDWLALNSADAVAVPPLLPD